MSRAVITKSLLTSIANAIRAKTGTQGTMTPAQMATAISNITGTPPAILIDDNATYPENYTWPYATMRKYQFYSGAKRTQSDSFFINLNLGALQVVPRGAFQNGTSGGASTDKLRTVIGTEVTELRESAFGYCDTVTSFCFPKLRAISAGGLSSNQCAILDFPLLQSVGQNGLRDNNVIQTVDFPSLVEIGVRGFASCAALHTVKLRAIESIGSQAFQSCGSLTNLVIAIGENAPLPTLADANAFALTKIANDALGRIYITDSRVDELKTATNWAAYASKICPLSEFPTSM